MKTFQAALIAGLLALASPAAASSTVTFDDVTPGSFLSSYTSAGIQFTNTYQSAGYDLFFPADITNIDPNGSSVLGYPLQAKVDGGGTFDLAGFTFGLNRDLPGAGLATGAIHVSYEFDNGTVENVDYEITGFGPQTIVVDKVNLRFATWRGGAIFFDQSTCGTSCAANGGMIGPFAIDNVIVDNVLVTGDVVPEPQTWALMITGFGLAGSVLRRRYRMPIRTS